MSVNASNQQQDTTFDTQWIEAIIRRYENDRNTCRVIRYEVEGASGGGDSFTSSLERWRVKVVLGSGQRRTKKLIVKVLPQSKINRNYLKKYFVVQREIMVYEVVFHHLEEIMALAEDRRETLWCDIIGYRPYDTIILQDLTEANYVVRDRLNFMDLDHILLAVRGLARFHALSKIAISRQIIDTNILTPYQLVYDPKFVEVLVEGAILGLYRGMKAGWGPTWNDIAEKVKKAADNCEKIMLDLGNNSSDMHNTINHGDLWMCNLLFKYDDYRDSPISIKFIDFQLVHYNSFAWDLIALLYTTITPDFRREHINEIYEAYHETLTKTYIFYEYNGPYPKLEDIRKEMDRLEFFAFVIICNMLPLTVSEVDLPFNVEVFELEGKGKEGFDTEVYKSDLYKKHAADDLLDLATRGII